MNQKTKNIILISGKAPLTILGIVDVAVALRLVPNCSAPIVINMIQNPKLKPGIAQITYWSTDCMYAAAKFATEYKMIDPNKIVTQPFLSPSTP